MITYFVTIYCIKQKKHMIFINFQLSLIDLLDCKQLILCMIIFYWRTYLPFHITIPKRYDIGIFLNIIVNHWILLVRKYMWEITYYFISTIMVNYIFIIYKTKQKIYISFIFIKCTELDCNGTYSDVYCVSILFKKIGMVLDSDGKAS